MTQAERDWLVALKKAKKRLITQKEAALELGVTERHVRRLLRSLKRRGDKAVIHALRGEKSNRRIEEEIRERATKILSQEVYRGFGPTLASEYLAKKHVSPPDGATIPSAFVALEAKGAPPGACSATCPSRTIRSGAGRRGTRS